MSRRKAAAAPGSSSSGIQDSAGRREWGSRAVGRCWEEPPEAPSWGAGRPCSSRRAGENEEEWGGADGEDERVRRTETDKVVFTFLKSVT